MKKICSHGGETTQRFAKGRALTLVGRRLWLHPVGPYGITADSYSHVTVEQQREAADRAGPTTGADNEDQADDDTTLLIGSWRSAGMGWLTTGDAALANASAARARDEPIAGMIEPPEGPSA